MGKIPPSFPQNLAAALGLLGREQRDRLDSGLCQTKLGLGNSLVLVDIDGNKNMNGTLLLTIGQYTTLTELHLQLNKISGSIPTEVGKLTTLTESLVLNENQIHR